jgi:hypothetical protein
MGRIEKKMTRPTREDKQEECPGCGHPSLFNGKCLNYLRCDDEKRERVLKERASHDQTD